MIDSDNSALKEDNPITRVLYGSENANRALIEFVHRTMDKIDSCVSSTAPSVIIEVEAIKNARITSVKNRGIKLRYVTEITADNLEYCKEMLTFSEIRHLKGMKGNFEVADEKEYVAVATLHKAQPIPQLIFSNVPEVVEQQQFVFDSFWERAMPAEQIIREIEEGIVHPVTTVYNDYKQAEKEEFEMIKRATKEIQIIYSTANAFHLQEKSGTLELLKNTADQNKNLQISIMVPIDHLVKKSLTIQLLKKSLNKNIQIQDIAPSIDIKIKSLVVDRKESLIMELKHLETERLTASIGFSIYSNSLPIVSSYSSIFEVIYNQSVLFAQIKQEGELKDEFINVAAHELRTPIMPIINGLELLEEKLGPGRKSEFQKELDIITRNATRLEMLAESILQVSRIESGTFQIDIEKDIDIHSLICQVIEDIDKKYLYTDKLTGITISFLPFKEMGNSSSGDERVNTQRPLSLLTDCDPDKIRQVIFNLLDNAVRFTFQGKVVVSTQLTSIIDYFDKAVPMGNGIKKGDTFEGEFYENLYDERNKNIGNNKMVIVSVQNEGEGVDPLIKDQMFEKFATKSAQGTGLGLYLSKKIVEAHEGMIWMEEYANLNTISDKNENVDGNRNGSYADIKKRQKITILKFAFPIVSVNRQMSDTDFG